MATALRLILLARLGLTGLDAQAHDIQQLVAVLAASESVDTEAVGYFDVETPTWTAYARLRDLASPEDLRRLLLHPSPVVRVYALQALARDPDLDAAELLLSRLADRAPVRTVGGCTEVRSTVADEAFDALAPRLDASARERLWEVLLSQEPLSSSAIRALREWTPPEPLYPTILQHVRRGTNEALAALAHFQQPEDVPLIASRLPEAPWQALRAIYRFPHPDFLPVLREMQPRVLADPASNNMPAIFYEVAAAFGREALDILSAPLEAALVEHRRQHVRGVFHAVSTRDEPAFDPLRFRIWEDYGWVDCATFDRLRAADPDRALQALEGTLREPNRVSNTQCLAQLLSWSDELTLVAALEAADAVHFEVVATEAARQRAQAAVEVLLRRFREEKSHHIYLAAAEALLAYDDAEVRARLMKRAPAKLRRTRDGALKELLTD